MIGVSSILLMKEKIPNVDSPITQQLSASQQWTGLPISFKNTKSHSLLGWKGTHMFLIVTCWNTEIIFQDLLLDQKELHSWMPIFPTKPNEIDVATYKESGNFSS